MVKAILTSLTMLVSSFYLFPIGFRALPGFNSKMILAAIGLFLFIINLPRHREQGLSKPMAWLSLGALLVSFLAVLSVTYNSTPDYAYCSYIISMWVWVGGAYAVVCLIRKVHGTASIILIGSYLVAVGVFQCVTALLIDTYPAFKAFTVDYFDFGQEWLDSVDRIYGFGACLDTAGMRFSAILVIIVAIINHISRTRLSRYIPIYLASFMLITVVGNIIARTTTIGVMLALAFMAYNLTIGYSRERRKKTYKVAGWAALIGILGIGITAVYYKSSEVFQEHLRFGFEGFFSLVEKGKWDVASNNKLESMYVFPETLKTWLVGDGYFANPHNVDPYYIGKYVEGWYMGTDVGYLRFIFYFGLPGLLAFSLFIIYAGIFCIKLSPGYKRMFVFLLLVNFAIWFKVSTDQFMIFALFLMLNPGENMDFERRLNGLPPLKQ